MFVNDGDTVTLFSDTRTRILKGEERARFLREVADEGNAWDVSGLVARWLDGSAASRVS